MNPRLFCSTPLAGRRAVDLPEGAAHHARRVLRLKVGDAVTLFDGAGGEFAGRIAAGTDAVRVDLGEWLAVEREAAFEVTLAQALPGGDKMDWVVQKAVELGVARIVPLAAARCVVRLAGERATRRIAHWQSVAVAACEQCGRNRVPEVMPLCELRAWLAALPPQPRPVRLLLSATGGMPLRGLTPAAGAILLVGPEGGLTDEEAAAALASGFVATSLGPRVLRTETAALAALAGLAALHA